MLTLVLAAASLSHAGVDAYIGAQIRTAAGPPIEDGVLLIEDGRVLAVGPADAVDIPEDATRHDVSEKVIIPGLVDTHSHIANTGDLNEPSGPLQSGLSAIDAIDTTLPSLQLAQAGGITTANIMPGSGNLMGGQTAYVKLRDAGNVDDLLFCSDRRTEICGGMKMANGTNPRRGGAYPGTRMASAFQQRGAFLDGQARLEELGEASSDTKSSKKKGGSNAAEDIRPDLVRDPLAQILRGERIVHFHTHRADDIITAIQLSEEFDFPVVLHHVSEAWKVADEIAESDAMASLILIDSPGGKEEAVEIEARNAAEMEKRGVIVSLHTDDPITDSRLFLRSGGIAIRAGMSEAGALKALTINGAIQMGLQDRIGTLEPGKDADFVILDGPPFSVWTHVEETYVDGTRTFSRAEEPRLSTGGYDVADRYPGGAR